MWGTFLTARRGGSRAGGRRGSGWARCARRGVETVRAALWSGSGGIEVVIFSLSWLDEWRFGQLERRVECSGLGVRAVRVRVV